MSADAYAELEEGAILYRVDEWMGDPTRTDTATVEKVTARTVTIRTDGGAHLPSWSRRAERLPGLVVSDPVAKVGENVWHRTRDAALRHRAEQLIGKAEDAERRARDMRNRATMIVLAANEEEGS